LPDQFVDRRGTDDRKVERLASQNPALEHGDYLEIHHQLVAGRGLELRTKLNQHAAHAAAREHLDIGSVRVTRNEHATQKRSSRNQGDQPQHRVLPR
jgi:hypothetical protein